MIVENKKIIMLGGKIRPVWHIRFDKRKKISYSPFLDRELNGQSWKWVKRGRSHFVVQRNFDNLFVGSIWTR